MTKYRSLEDIEKANQEPENETPKERTRRLARIKQARKRFLDKQREKSKSELIESESSSKVSSRTRSRTTASATERKRKSRAALTEE